jgi:3-oxoacyl-[acyl-carrier protein] reductase
MNDTDRFDGMTALVTGASSGIGAATAVALGARGAHVLVHFNSEQSGACSVLAKLKRAGGTGELLQADLSSMDGVRRLARDVAGLGIEILINNAGSLIRRTRVMQMSEEIWQQTITLNFSSAFFLAQAVLAHMVERKHGYIVNVSSVAARNGGGLGALAYASAKSALSTMTKGLAKEFGPLGIRINAVSPGTVDTDYHRNFSNEEMLAAVRAATPLGRLGTAEEIADVILFLCRHEAGFIQGQVIEVNGGFLMV